MEEVARRTFNNPQTKDTKLPQVPAFLTHTFDYARVVGEYWAERVIARISLATPDCSEYYYHVPECVIWCGQNTGVCSRWLLNLSYS